APPHMSHASPPPRPLPTRPPPPSPLFPYTTLFRSLTWRATAGIRVLPPTSRTRPRSAGASPASRRALLTGSTVRASRSPVIISRSEEHTSELQSRFDLVCRLLLEKHKETVTHRPTA